EPGHGAPAHEEAADEAARHLTAGRARRLELAGGERRGEAAGDEADDEDAIVGEDGLLDDGGAATQAVEAEQRIGQKAGAAGGGAGEAAELGGDAERSDAEIGDHGDDADGEPGDGAGPALDEDAPENGGKRRRWHGDD